MLCDAKVVTNSAAWLLLPREAEDRLRQKELCKDAAGDHLNALPHASHEPFCTGLSMPRLSQRGQREKCTPKRLQP